MKIICLLFVSILILSADFFAQNNLNDAKIEKELIGVWQASPSVASGMNDNYQFFGNGRYKFNYNQMNGEKRILSHSGNWQIKDGNLILTLEEIEIIIGGNLEKANGSTATDFEIIGGNFLKKKVLPVEKIKLSLEKIVKADFQNTTTINGTKYWKLSNDPKTYEN